MIIQADYATLSSFDIRNLIQKSEFCHIRFCRISVFLDFDGIHPPAKTDHCRKHCTALAGKVPVNFPFFYHEEVKSRLFAGKILDLYGNKGYFHHSRFGSRKTLNPVN